MNETNNHPNKQTQVPPNKREVADPERRELIKQLMVSGAVLAVLGPLACATTLPSQQERNKTHEFKNTIEKDYEMAKKQMLDAVKHITTSLDLNVYEFSSLVGPPESRFSASDAIQAVIFELNQKAENSPDKEQLLQILNNISLHFINIADTFDNEYKDQGLSTEKLNNLSQKILQIQIKLNLKLNELFDLKESLYRKWLERHRPDMGFLE
jgi:hypothetical protein